MSIQKIKNIKHYIFSFLYGLYYGFPSRKLKVIGVTGTDGKTTTSNMIYEILKCSGKKVGLLSTINAKIAGNELDTGFHVTTPSPALLQKVLKDMVDSGLEYVVLETTSHALDQFRVGGIDYDIAVFTNITREHLDYHKTYDNYLLTKARLMNQLKKNGLAIINKDDISYEKLFQYGENLRVRIARYGFSSGCEICASDKSNAENWINHFEVQAKGIKSFDLRLKMQGGYNAYNALAAISVALELGVDSRYIIQSLEGMQSLQGRWEVIQEKPFQVIVDFAHTPNALENALTLAKSQIDPHHSVIVVFGCAGKRDEGKRPLMGEIAGRLADRTIITAEDPRGEIDLITTQIEDGIKRTGRKAGKEYFKIPDRRLAIRKALELAKPGDIVIITGKGHEKSMNIDGRTELPWSDQDAVSEELKR